MKKTKNLVFLLVFLLLFGSVSFAADTPTASTSNPSVSLVFDKTSCILIGDIVKASLKIQDVAGLSGYHVNIKFDPTVLQFVNPYTGIPYAYDTFPVVGGCENKFTIMNNVVSPPIDNNDYPPILRTANHDLANGILNFGECIMDTSLRQTYPMENNIYAEIGFKVLKNVDTEVEFQDAPTLPNAVNGTVLFDWSSQEITNYSVIQPPIIKPEICPPPPSYPSISLVLDKTTAEVGEIIKASLKIENVAGLAGYYVNIKFDPSVLQFVNPYTGTPYGNSTFPVVGGKGNDYKLMNNVISPPVDTVEYPPILRTATHDLANGILNFGECIMDTSLRQYYPMENNIYAEIGFKVLKKVKTEVMFQNTPSMPNAERGTLLFDWNSSKVSAYNVNQPPVINDGALACKISGFVKPDVDDLSSDSLAGFKVEIVGENYSTVTDSKGFYELSGIPCNKSGYVIRVSKPGYLSRDIKYIILKEDIQLGTSQEPVIIWPGDISIDGVQDDAINMADVMLIAKSFGSVKADLSYNSEFDYNMDEAINMTDIMYVIRHFNTDSSNYPAFTYSNIQSAQ